MNTYLNQEIEYNRFKLKYCFLNCKICIILQIYILKCITSFKIPISISITTVTFYFI